MNLATKEDTYVLKQDVNLLRQDINSLRQEVKQDSALQEQRVIIKLGAIVSIALGVAVALAKLVH